MLRREIRFAHADCTLMFAIVVLKMVCELSFASLVYSFSFEIDMFFHTQTHIFPAKKNCGHVTRKTKIVDIKHVLLQEKKAPPGTLTRKQRV